jgi:hypothetical protein
VPISKPWIDCRNLDISELPGTVGDYELGDSNGQVIYIGYAGGKSHFGLRGAIAQHRGGEEDNPIIRERIANVRFEVTTAYLTRHLDLLSRHRVEFGALPAGNASSAASLPPLARFKLS